MYFNRENNCIYVQYMAGFGPAPAKSLPRPGKLDTKGKAAGIGEFFA
jgi:hypothetical protein